MSTDAERPTSDSVGGNGFAHDEGWELPEIAPVLIVISVGLLVVGSGISTGLSLAGQEGFSGAVGWSIVETALRWISPSTSTMLLLSAALIWWQYGYWSSNQRAGLPEEIIDVHIARLRGIAKWNLAAFIAIIASVVLLIVASILQNTYQGSTLYIWADSVDTFCEAVGIILLSLLGVVGLKRILAAAHEVIEDLN